MHFLLTAIGSYGDVHPMVGLGATLARRGHRVSLVTNPYFTDVVARAGLELIPIGTVDDYERLIAFRDLWHPVRGVPFLLREAVVEGLRPLYEILEANYVAGETVIAVHVLDAASRVFRESRQAPVATITFSPQAIWSDITAPTLGGLPIGPRWPRWWNNLQFRLGSKLIVDPLIKGPLNAFRREFGLAPAGRLFPTWWFQSDANVCLFPEWFAPVADDWPRPVQGVGFPLWDAGDDTPLTNETEEFLNAGSPPIVFAAGTANKHAAEYFQTAVEVCERLNERGVLLTKFADQLPATLPHTVRYEPFVPLSRLLPRARLFVHHGGVGSSSQALAAGVPQLVRPLAFDQYDNADRLCKLGVAESIVPRRFTTSRVATTIKRLTTSMDVKAACEHWQQRSSEQHALETACDVLESLRSGD